MCLLLFFQFYDCIACVVFFTVDCILCVIINDNTLVYLSYHIFSVVILNRYSM